MQMNAVDSLLTRLKLDKYIERFRERNIVNPKLLRSLPSHEIESLIPDAADREEFQKAIDGGVVPVASPQGRAPAAQDDHRDYDDHHADRNRRSHRGGRGGGKGKGDYSYGDDYHDGGRGSKGGYRGGGMYDDFSHDSGKGGKGHKGGNRDYNNDYQRSAPREYDDDLPDALETKPDVIQVTVRIPTFTVPFLLANKAQKLNAIHHEFGTTNSRLNKPESAENQSPDTTFCLYGPSQDVVDRAKKEIERIVGIERKNKSETRFQDALLGRTKAVTSLLYALNERRIANKADTALSSECIPEHVSQFLFCNPYGHIQQFYIKVSEKARAKVDVVGKILAMVPTCQTLVFCGDGAHITEILQKRIKSEQLSGLQPDFLVPSMQKEKREEVLRKFAEGKGPLDKKKYEKKKDDDRKTEDEYNELECEVGGFATNKNRFLITTDDYARYARNKPIPYCSLVISYDNPKTKESYLYRVGCCGRGGRRGVAISLISPNEMDSVEQLGRFGLQIKELPANFFDALETCSTDDLMEPDTK